MSHTRSPGAQPAAAAAGTTAAVHRPSRRAQRSPGLRAPPARAAAPLIWRPSLTGRLAARTALGAGRLGARDSSVSRIRRGSTLLVAASYSTPVLKHAPSLSSSRSKSDPSLPATPAFSRHLASRRSSAQRASPSAVQDRRRRTAQFSQGHGPSTTTTHHHAPTPRYPPHDRYPNGSLHIRIRCRGQQFHRQLDA